MAQVYTVKQGDTLISIAHHHGFYDYAAIWDHAENSALRQARPNPQVLHAGDRLFIPDVATRSAACGTDRLHRFRLKLPPAFLRLHIQDDDGTPLVGREYELKVGVCTFAGETGPDGLIHHRVPPTAAVAELKVWLDERTLHAWDLEIGHLDPAETIAGVQARLNNLGYDAGEVTGAMNDETRAALAEFQDDFDLESSPRGELDDATRAALVEAHDRS